MNHMPKGTGVPSSGGTLCSEAAVGELRAESGPTRELVWQLPEEVPVALQFNSEPFAVMMATPADLKDFAVGFAVTEGLIASADAIRGVLVMPVENGMTVDVAVDSAGFNAASAARRTIEGRTGCGLCGVEDIASALKTLPPAKDRKAPDTAAILRAAKALADHQPMNAKNRSVHGAAWVAASGDIVIVREDVGRHNALDKLIGALKIAGTDLPAGFVLMSSRCSFELVQKCAIAGIGALITVSAPTTLALKLAREANIFLGALAGGGVAVFNA